MVDHTEVPDGMNSTSTSCQLCFVYIVSTVMYMYYGRKNNEAEADTQLMMAVNLDTEP